MAQLELVSGCIRASIRDQVLYVTLDRAAKRNALTRAMYEDLTRCIQRAGAGDDVRAILVDAKGEMFCAGNDIGDFIDAAPGDPGEIAAGPALAFIKTLAACDVPVVAAVQGQATGIGTTLLLHVDLVVAADSARFYTAFVDLALVPEAASSLLLPALIGRQNAARLLLAGDTLDAVEAERAGLVAYRVPEAELAARAHDLACRLAAKPPEAVRLSKRLLRAGLNSDDVNGQIEREAQALAQRLASDEARAIMRRFLD